MVEKGIVDPDGRPTTCHRPVAMVSLCESTFAARPPAAGKPERQRWEPLWFSGLRACGHLAWAEGGGQSPSDPTWCREEPGPKQELLDGMVFVDTYPHWDAGPHVECWTVGSGVVRRKTYYGIRQTRQKQKNVVRSRAPRLSFFCRALQIHTTGAANWSTLTLATLVTLVTVVYGKKLLFNSRKF